MSRPLALVAVVGGFCMLPMLGCGTTLMAVQPETGVPDQIRIWFKNIDDEVFSLGVSNTSGEPVTLSLDDVTLITPMGVRRREAPSLMGLGWGGSLSAAMQKPTITLAPGAVESVTLRYDFGRSPRTGEVWQLDFAGAVFVNGRPVSVGPIALRGR